jgi:hypothetical protein
VNVHCAAVLKFHPTLFWLAELGSAWLNQLGVAFKYGAPPGLKVAVLLSSQPNFVTDGDPVRASHTVVKAERARRPAAHKKNFFITNVSLLQLLCSGLRLPSNLISSRRPRPGGSGKGRITCVYLIHSITFCQSYFASVFRWFSARYELGGAVGCWTNGVLNASCHEYFRISGEAILLEPCVCDLPAILIAGRSINLAKSTLVLPRWRAEIHALGGKGCSLLFHLLSVKGHAANLRP